jgi:hypothetical protein
MPQKRVKSVKKLARLNPYEDKCWVFAFCYYLDRGRSERQADKLAWRDLQKEFPRLRNYKGCESNYGKEFLRRMERFDG